MRKILQSPEDIFEKKLAQEELKELSRSMSEPRLNKLYEIAHESCKKEYFANIDFYIVLVPTNEPTPEQTPLDRVFVRRSCPTPAYNQNVFKYHKDTDTLEFLWSIPKRYVYYQLLANKQRYLNHPTLKSRTSFVVLMETGELEKWVMRENKEEGKEKAIISIKKEAEA